MQAEKRHFHRSPRAPTGRMQGKIAMSANHGNIEEATKILTMKFAKPTDIAWAWEILKNKEYQSDEVRYRKIHDKTKLINKLGLQTYCKDGRLSMQIKGVRELTLDADGKVVPEDVTESQYVIVEDIKKAMIRSGKPWPMDVLKPAISAPEVIKSDIDKPWLVHNPLDPLPDNSWYTPARYFARKILKEKPLLINNKLKLAGEVATLLFKIKDYPRGRVTEREPSTVLKAFTNCTLT